MRHSPAKLRQPRPRHPRTSCALPPNPASVQASWKCSRPIRCGRIAVQPISSDNPGRGCGAGLRAPRPRGLDPAHPSHLSRDSDRSRQGERYEATIRAHGPEFLENLNTPNWPEVMSSESGEHMAFTQAGTRSWDRKKSKCIPETWHWCRVTAGLLEICACSQGRRIRGMPRKPWTTQLSRGERASGRNREMSTDHLGRESFPFHPRLRSDATHQIGSHTDQELSESISTKMCMSQLRPAPI